MNKIKKRKNNSIEVATLEENRKKLLQQKRNKRRILGIVILVVFIVALIGIGMAVVNLIQNPTNTFVVEKGTLSLEENIIGYIIRDEAVIQGENYKNGMEKLKAEGERVAKGESIFRYYSAGEDKLLKQIEDIDRKLQEALANQKDLTSSDIKAIEKEIDQKLEEIYMVNDTQKLRELKKDLHNSLTKKAKIAGEKSPSGSYIRKLSDERQSLAKQLNTGSEYIKAKDSGIVSYRIDGLENVLTTEDFSTLNKQTLENLNLKTGQMIATSEEAGKVINNFKAYIVCISKSEEAKNANIGDKVKIRINATNVIDAQIEYISDEGEEGKLLVFSIRDKIEELINYRKMSLTLIWWSYTGLKVPNSSIQYENNLAYVMRNRAGYLDKLLVKVKHQNSKYSLVQAYTAEEIEELGIDSSKNSKKISLYDEIFLNPDLSKAN